MNFLFVVISIFRKCTYIVNILDFFVFVSYLATKYTCLFPVKNIICCIMCEYFYEILIKFYIYIAYTFFSLKNLYALLYFSAKQTFTFYKHRKRHLYSCVYNCFEAHYCAKANPLNCQKKNSKNKIS